MRMGFYVNDAFEVTTSELNKAFQHALTKGQFKMADIADIAEVVQGGDFEVKVAWVGFEYEESSCELLQTIWEGAPQFVRTELLKLGLSRAVHLKLQ